eukprot:6189580-Pleurochrysis_carterae.AAC.2
MAEPVGAHNACIQTRDLTSSSSRPIHVGEIYVANASCAARSTKVVRRPLGSLRDMHDVAAGTGELGGRESKG